jgi:hypothetical protein
MLIVESYPSQYPTILSPIQRQRITERQCEQRSQLRDDLCQTPTESHQVLSKTEGDKWTSLLS